MALARVKTYWTEMEASTIATQSLVVGRVSAEHYFEEVLEGARSIEAYPRRILCSSDMYSLCKNNVLLNYKGCVYTFA